ncbi:MAG: alpha/beta hydrolase [Deltaproteobacteria bacterium]|nr:alpha/beta hydrolase [Deltaproteobacteria bacterium]
MDHHPFRSPEARERYLSLHAAHATKWPVPSDEGLLESSWGTTFVRSSGPLDGPPLLLLPGVGISSNMWIPNAAALSAAFRIHAVDNIYDFGRSVFTRPVTCADDFVAWLAELVDIISPDQPILLCGISYGGWIASRFSLAHPERVAKLALLAPVATVGGLSFSFIWRAVGSTLPFRAFTKMFIEWIAEDALADGEVNRALVDDMLEHALVAPRAFVRRRMVPPDRLNDEELAALPPETLFLVGEHEKIYDPAEVLARLASVAPHVQTQVVEGAGHDLTIARSDEVNAALVAHFLGSTA